MKAESWRDISIERFINAIEQLPSAPPVQYPGKWYSTQKEHWLGWLWEYHGPGAYGRKSSTVRDSKYVYNHIVEPKMLLWLIEAAGIEPEMVTATKNATAGLFTMQQQSAAIRRKVPWEQIARALFED